jgi:3-keto-disaccharide hydrolase
MTHRLSFLILLLLPLRLLGQEQPKPNSLTEKEIQDGWVLLFDGETSFGWKPEGEVKVEQGILKLGGTKASSIDLTTLFHACQIQLEYCRDGEAEMTNAGHTTALPLPNQLRWVKAAGRFAAEKGNSWSFTDPEGKYGAGEKGDASSGLGQFRLAVAAKAKLELRNIKLRPTEVKPIFNGKTLEGWKSFPGEKYKSKFSVTSEGWLNVKNGPGDLQTDQEWADFVLQLECISNGKALNSGIFFRCLPNQYQKGYEAQIQNGFKDGDRTRPTDYGTGAIYNRIAARKVVSNDNQWFTMTIVARGKHLATWVDGYQTVDWDDNRKESDNARLGCKTGKGHVSIQGHDPTTDLSFRNFRLAELPKQ